MGSTDVREGKYCFFRLNCGGKVEGCIVALLYAVEVIFLFLRGLTNQKRGKALKNRNLNPAVLVNGLAVNAEHMVLPPATDNALHPLFRN